MQVVNGAPSETLEAELEKRRSVEAMSGDVFDKTGESLGGDEKVRHLFPFFVFSTP